ncbi:unnamed protein product [Gordionus sp. m RMFG-2023]
MTSKVAKLNLFDQKNLDFHQITLDRFIPTKCNYVVTLDRTSQLFDLKRKAQVIFLNDRSNSNKHETIYEVIEKISPEYDILAQKAACQLNSLDEDDLIKQCFYDHHPLPTSKIKEQTLFKSKYFFKKGVDRNISDYRRKKLPAIPIPYDWLVTMPWIYQAWYFDYEDSDLYFDQLYNIKPQEEDELVYDSHYSAVFYHEYLDFESGKCRFDQNDLNKSAPETSVLREQPPFLKNDGNDCCTKNWNTKITRSLKSLRGEDHDRTLWSVDSCKNMSISKKASSMAIIMPSFSTINSSNSIATDFIHFSKFYSSLPYYLNRSTYPGIPFQLSTQDLYLESYKDIIDEEKILLNIKRFNKIVNDPCFIKIEHAFFEENSRLSLNGKVMKNKYFPLLQILLNAHQKNSYLTSDPSHRTLPCIPTHFGEIINKPTMVKKIGINDIHLPGNLLHSASIRVINLCKWNGIQKYDTPVSRFLVSFMVDARGGAMRGCRHSGLRVIIPPRKAATPIRVTCRFVKPEKMANSPPLMEGEGLACRILELGPAGTKFLGPVIIEIPHFASLRGSEREITILRSDNGETWREHVLEASESAVQEVLNESFDGEDSLDDLQSNRITRILTNDFPLYFAIISRIHQETHSIGPEGGIISSTIVPMVQAMFPEGALTKRIRIGLQAHPISPEMVTKMLGNRVAVSPVVTIEPRRRKFHKPITLTIPLPQASNKGMINQYNSSNDAPTLRLLCSITGGITPAQWEDITGSTPLTFVNNYVSFTTTVSARFWLMDCRQVNDATKFGTEVYKEATHVPYMVRMLVFGKRQSNNDIEGYIRAFVITDDKIDKTLEHQERFKEIAQSRDVEVLDNKPIFLETMGNLIQITKSDTSRFIEDNFMPHAASPTNFYNSYHSNINIPNSGEATSPIFNSNLNGLLALNTNILALKFKPFQENRLPFKVRIKDPNQEPIGRLLFLGDPPYATLVKPAAHPICTLNIVLPTEFKVYYLSKFRFKCLCGDSTSNQLYLKFNV